MLKETPSKKMIVEAMKKPQYLVKRDSTKTNFETYKLDLVIHNLKLEDHEVEILKAIFSDLAMKDTVSAAEVAESFVDSLTKLGFVDEAKAYIEYRKKDDADWNKQIDTKARLKRMIEGDPSIVNENANKDSEIFSTQRDLTAGTVGKTVGLTMMPEHIAKAHLRGDIHWHDLDYTPLSPMTNCCLIDFKEMLTNGFKVGNAFMTSPNSIGVATSQVAQIITQVASSQYGGCSFDRADEVLAPFAQKNYDHHLEEAQEFIDDEEKAKAFAKKRTQKDIYDAMQSLEYEINTMFSSQGQTPFTTLGFGLGTNWIEKEIQKDILKIRLAGLGKDKRTAIFPKLVFTLKKGLNLNPGDPNYDVKEIALECATYRMYPDVVSYDTIKRLTGSFKAPMGCRSFLQGWKDKNGKEVNSGRMNLGVITLNLPRIAMESRGDKDLFWKIFEDKVQLVHDAMNIKAARCREAKPENAPVLYENGAFGKRLKPDEDVNQLFENGRCTISFGYIGLYEVGTVFYGPNWEYNKEAHDFTVEIVKRMHDWCAYWEKTEKYHYHYSVYSTPSESLTDRFCVLDTEKFGKVKDITDKEYYTNSFHYDVRKHPTPFEKLEFEKDYPPYAAGGFIHYCEYPNLKQNPKALEAVWDFGYDKVGYLGTNTPIDRCFKCGFAGEFKATAKGFECPVCGNHDPETCDCVKRTCGYLGNPLKRPMVHGRHEEIAHRAKHMSLGMVRDQAQEEEKIQDAK
ncbi:anaerobic ribonucleoside-triphosphate reductase [Lactobacillus mulieris]|uniref:anaerobic ribonucleoside-triphosphate reductase n=1 Tax=Lactobacillus mulieris TaxID=2508708 RepID=UPI00143318DA|nr:anaerobic ribonucleoside-triphosphate reductase [Lactobacillus mulieris]MCF1783355.1 anaerobic ribonucleoside-triphosphate reductase [Lactobacillus mulieris]MCW8104964.1 anaerobic ribonucleoside-triphosphate reductase [Lactobacillus mulieris]MDK6803865.1 anaerobic ribonucleoside-triphosphate reductase [Lactobacillus mulieris]MDK8383050.1 anaerobic ribonucleoside-triphosphate reductase [Lactobacillus mulieris]MDT9620333.1 anaerobic ribonucleoside-triphosphate reductase [Lactobacillus mulieri